MSLHGKGIHSTFCNALHVPSMNNNLIPPFVMRETGIIFNDTLKIQVKEPTAEDHTILFEDSNFRIPLSLWGIFSYFPTSTPKNEQINGCDNVYLLTPNGIWNPHSDAYACNEENMLDWEGHMVERQHRKQILLSELQEDTAMAFSAVINSAETSAVDRMMPKEAFICSTRCDSPPSTMSLIYDQDHLSSLLTERAQDSQFMMSIGSTNAWPS
jgi:hypothetical protein